MSDELAKNHSLWSFLKSIGKIWWTVLLGGWVFGVPSAVSEKAGYPMTGLAVIFVCTAAFLVAAFLSWRNEVKARLEAEGKLDNHGIRLVLNFHTQRGLLFLRVTNRGSRVERIESVKLIVLSKGGTREVFESKITKGCRDKGEPFLLQDNANEDFEFRTDANARIGVVSMTLLNFEAIKYPEKAITHYFASVLLENGDTFSTPRVEVVMPEVPPEAPLPVEEPENSEIGFNVFFHKDNPGCITENDVDMGGNITFCQCRFFRIAVSAIGAVIKNCKAVLTQIDMDGGVVFSGERIPLTFSPGEDPDACAKTIDPVQHEFLDLLFVHEENFILCTVGRKWNHKPELHLLFEVPGDLTFHIRITGENAQPKLFKADFKWRRWWNKSELTLHAIP